MDASASGTTAISSQASGEVAGTGRPHYDALAPPLRLYAIVESIGVELFEGQATQRQWKPPAYLGVAQVPRHGP
jgi:hypothetical protein